MLIKKPGKNNINLLGFFNLFKIKKLVNDVIKLPPAESPINIIYSILSLY